mgnify:CR=1 FL=1
MPITLLDFLISAPMDTINIVGADFNVNVQPLESTKLVLQGEDEIWGIRLLETSPLACSSPGALQIASLIFRHTLRACNGRFPSDHERSPTFKHGKSARHHIIDFNMATRKNSDCHTLVAVLDARFIIALAATRADQEIPIPLPNNRRAIKCPKIILDEDKIYQIYSALLELLGRLTDSSSQKSPILDLHCNLFQELRELFIQTSRTRIKHCKKLAHHAVCYWKDTLCDRSRQPFIRSNRGSYDTPKALKMSCSCD